MKKRLRKKLARGTRKTEVRELWRMVRESQMELGRTDALRLNEERLYDDRLARFRGVMRAQSIPAIERGCGPGTRVRVEFELMVDEFDRPHVKAHFVEKCIQTVMGKIMRRVMLAPESPHKCDLGMPDGLSDIVTV